MGNSTSKANRLLFLGMFLFLMGLLVGFIIPNLANPRMGVSGHLEGVMNGLFLLVLGLIWHKISLSSRSLTLTYWLAIYGAFANFIAVLIGAITGAGKMMPIAGGMEGSAMIEAIISFLLYSLSFAMVAVCIFVLRGLYIHNSNQE